MKKEKIFTTGEVSFFGVGKNTESYEEKGMIQVETVLIGGKRFLASASDLEAVKKNAIRIEQEAEERKKEEIRDNQIANLASQKKDLLGEMQMHQLLGDLEKAKAVAQKVKEINEAIEQLKEGEQS